MCSPVRKKLAAARPIWLAWRHGSDHLLLLAAIQGITEFIPVSSSGHLQLVHGLTALPDHGLAVDVALHAGTLLAVMAYFYRDVGLMLVGARDIVRRQPSARRISFGCW